MGTDFIMKCWGAEAWLESPRGGNPEAPLEVYSGRKDWKNRRKSEAAATDGPDRPQVRSTGSRDLGTQTHPMHAPDPQAHSRSPVMRSEVEGWGGCN